MAGPRGRATASGSIVFWIALAALVAAPLALAAGESATFTGRVVGPPPTTLANCNPDGPEENVYERDIRIEDYAGMPFRLSAESTVSVRVQFLVDNPALHESPPVLNCRHLYQYNTGTTGLGGAVEGLVPERADWAKVTASLGVGDFTLEVGDYPDPKPLVPRTLERTYVGIPSKTFYVHQAVIALHGVETYATITTNDVSGQVVGTYYEVFFGTGYRHHDGVICGSSGTVYVEPFAEIKLTPWGAAADAPWGYCAGTELGTPTAGTWTIELT